MENMMKKRPAYTVPNSAGTQFTQIPVIRDTMMYARWMLAVPANVSLDESLACISSSAAEGDIYSITLSSDESIALQTLSYSGKTISITLLGGAAEWTLRVSASGWLFTVGSGVTLCRHFISCATPQPEGVTLDSAVWSAAGSWEKTEMVSEAIFGSERRGQANTEFCHK